MLFAALEAQYQSRDFKVSDVRAAIERDKYGSGTTELAEAVEAACGTVEKLGYWLRGHAGQVRDGRKLTKKTGPKTGHAVWQITQKTRAG